MPDSVDDRHSGIIRIKSALHYAVSPIASISREFFRALNRYAVPAIAAGLGNPLPVGAGPVVIETTGRVSGKLRRVPLLSVRCGDHLLVSTVRPDSQWFANLAANPQASVQLLGTPRSATATLTRGPLNVAYLQLN